MIKAPTSVPRSNDLESSGVPPADLEVIFVGGTDQAAAQGVGWAIHRLGDCAAPVEMALHAEPGGLPDLLEGKASLGGFEARCLGRWVHRPRGVGSVATEEQIKESCGRLAREYPNDPIAAARRFLVDLISQLVAGGDRRLLVDTSPDNLRYAQVLHELLPTARFVSAIRDGRDASVHDAAAREAGDAVIGLGRWLRRVRELDAGIQGREDGGAYQLPPGLLHVTVIGSPHGRGEYAAAALRNLGELADGHREASEADDAIEFMLRTHDPPRSAPHPLRLRRHYRHALKTLNREGAHCAATLLAAYEDRPAAQMSVGMTTASRMQPRRHRIVGGGNGTADGALPNLVIIGAQKCGTTALHHYLDTHPQIAMCKPNEPNFFVEHRNWHRGIDWYRQHFDPEIAVRGDQSPNYTTYPHDLGIPARMNAIVPDARLIYMVRDPVERIQAHWVHNCAKHRERGTVTETILHPYTTYIIRSMYALQLERFLEHYDRAGILVVEQEDLLTRRRQTLQEVFAFLDVDREFDHEEFDRLRHETGRKRRLTKAEMLERRVRRGTGIGSRLPGVIWSPMDVGSRAWRRLKPPIEPPAVLEILGDEVIDVLRGDATRLEQLTGRSFRHWSMWR